MVKWTKGRFQLSGILLIAVLLRFYGVGFGLPHTECRPDETSLVYKALGFFSGDLNPHFFNYPSLYMYTLFVVYGVYFLSDYLLGFSTSDMLTEVILHPDRFILISRLLSATLGSASVWMVYVISKRLLNVRTAKFAAFFSSVCYLHVRDSHFGTADVTMTFFILCSMYFIVEVYRTGSTLDYVLGGSFAGLATSTKYGGVLLVLPGVLAHVSHHAKLTTNPKSTASLLMNAFRSQKVWIFGISLILLFVIFTPFSVLDPTHFVADFKSEVLHLSRGHAEISLERGWWVHLRYTLPYGMGLAMFIGSLAGIVVHAKKDGLQALILFSFPGVLFIFAGGGHTVFVRYMIPALPFLCIGSAICLIQLGNRISALLPLLALVVASQSIYYCISFDGLLAERDNRLLAADWINQHASPGESIFHSSTWGQAQIPPSLATLEKGYEESRARGRQGRLLAATIAYYKSSGFSGGYQVKNQVDWDLSGEHPSYVLLYRSPLEAYNKVSESLERIVENDYILAAKFENTAEPTNAHWFDQQDAFYIPYFGFSGFQRPGPSIYIYRKNS